MRPALVLLLTACSSAPDHSDVVGPFTAPPQRFVVDHLQMPQDRLDWADDLDGDGRVDNQLGNVIELLTASDDSPVADDYLANGMIAPVLEVVNDGAIGAARWRGADGEDGDLVGGRFQNGTFTSNRDRYTHHPASGIVHLPIFVDADPSVTSVVGVELELSPDGGGGWNGVLHAAVHGVDLASVITPSIAQMLTADPASHQSLWDLLVAHGPGPLTSEDVANNSLFLNVTYPDIKLFDAAGNWAPSPQEDHRDSMSIGFAFHATPCDSGRCGTAPAITDACHDRERDGDETDVDCGGSCHACAGDLACAADADCQSRRCANGLCAAPSCSDGIRDEFESAVDCGGPCAPCARGSVCFRNDDCRSGKCNLGSYGLGQGYCQ